MMNTVTLELPTQLYSQLQTLAEDQQMDIVELLRRLLVVTNGSKPRPQAATGAFQRILDRATDLGVTGIQGVALGDSHFRKILLANSLSSIRKRDTALSSQINDR